MPRLALAQLLGYVQGALAALPRAADGAAPGALLCGDLNSQRSSSAVAALTAQPSPLSLVPVAPPADAADAHFTTWKFRSGRGCEANGDGSGSGNGSAAAPPHEKLEVIDHLLYSGALAPVAAWEQPARAAIGAGGLPCEAYPSDHVAQLVEFAWTPAGRDAASARPL